MEKKTKVLYFLYKRQDKTKKRTKKMTRKQEEFYRKYVELGMKEDAAAKALELIFETKNFPPKKKKDKIKYLLSRPDGIIFVENLARQTPFSKGEVDRPKEKGGPIKAKKGEKIALKTGQFETLFFSDLSDDEKHLLMITDISRKTQIEYELKLTTIRENRMLARIGRYNEKAEGMLLAYQETSSRDGKNEIKERREAVIKTVMLIEEALTRVQDSKVKFLRELARLEEFGKGDDDPQENRDKYLDALEKATADIWDEEE